MSDTFCVLPWVNITVDPDGSIKPCCISTDFIKKPNGTKFNLGYDTIEDIYNSSDFLDIRKKMLRGEKVQGCRQCYLQEGYSGKSQRLQFNGIFNKTFKEPVAETKIEYFDLRLGNLCNLSCKSCAPINSSQLDKEISQLQGTKISNYYTTFNLDINQWYQTKIFSDNLDSQLDNINRIYMTGGEPTIIQQNYDILEKLINLGKNKNITVTINSNLTNLNSGFVELLSQFKQVVFFASIDGTGLIQEYLRYPSKWSQISKNFEKLLENKNFVIRPTPVIQITNLNKIVELFDFFENYNKTLNYSRVRIMPIVLENPSHLNMLYLPLEFKKQCWQRIEDWLSTCKFQDNMFFTKLNALKTKCFLDVNPEDNLKKFIEYNSIFDENRGQSLEKVNPELYNIL